MGSSLPSLRPRAPARRVAALLTTALLVALVCTSGAARAVPAAPNGSTAPVTPANYSAVGNFSAAIGRLVDLVGVAGSGILALVWARVALSWFSHDVTKKVQAKDRARDALIGTLLFVAALSGLIWALAHWVLTGS